MIEFSCIFVHPLTVKPDERVVMGAGLLITIPLASSGPVEGCWDPTIAIGLAGGEFRGAGEPLAKNDAEGLLLGLVF